MKKILIADDPANANLSRFNLEIEGYLIKVVNNGIDVFKEIENFQPQVIVLDIQLGDSDGRTIARLIKNSIRLKDIKIILTSTIMATEKTQQIPEALYDRLIPKPYDMDELISTVKQLTLEK